MKGVLLLFTSYLLTPAGILGQIIDVHQHFSRRDGYFEDLERTYRPLGARACVKDLSPICLPSRLPRRNTRRL